MVVRTGSVGLEEAVEDVLCAAADAVARDVGEISSFMADVLVRETDVIPADPPTRADIVRRATAQILVHTSEFHRGAPREDTEPAREALAYTRFLARRNVPLETLLRIYRLGFGVLLRAWHDRLDLRGSTDVLAAVSQQLIDRLFAQHDVLLARLSTEYQHEREKYVRSAEALRRETILAILGERPVEVDRAASLLGYGLRRYHVGLVLWAEPSEEVPAVVPQLEHAVATVAARLGTGRPLLLSEGTATMWAWLGLDAEPAFDLEDACRAAPTGSGVSFAIGEPARGIAGFRRTHGDAMDAARVTRLAERCPGSIVPFRTVQLAALLSGEIDHARRFVQEQLGPLAVEDDEMGRMRATLTVYLEENASRVTTARRLGIHPNTVANRVRSCQQLLGRDLSRHQVRLQVALALAASLGGAVLRDAA